MPAAYRGIAGAVLHLLPIAVAMGACATELPTSKDEPRDLGAAIDEDAHGQFPVDDAGIAGDGGVDAAEVCAPRYPAMCPTPAPHYADVQPILARRCLTCHDGKGEQWPLLEYQHVADWSGFIRMQMLQCTMPPPDAGIPMPLEERELILAWIKCEAPP